MTDYTFQNKKSNCINQLAQEPAFVSNIPSSINQIQSNTMLKPINSENNKETIDFISSSIKQNNEYLITYSDKGVFNQKKSNEFNQLYNKQEEINNEQDNTSNDINAISNSNAYLSKLNENNLQTSNYLKGNTKEKVINQIVNELHSLYEQEHPKNINAPNANDDDIEDLEYETYINQSLIQFKQYLMEKKSMLNSNQQLSCNSNNTIGNNILNTTVSQIGINDTHNKYSETKSLLYNDDLITKDLLPILTKEGYTISPSFDKMLAMKRKKINRMRNVCISNQHGMIEWLKKIDIERMDFDKNLSIKPGSVVINPGQETLGLNKKAIVTLFNCFENSLNPQLQPQVLQLMVKSFGGKVIKSNQGIFSFKINHF